MSNLRFRLQLMVIALMLGIVTASAQEIRYVKADGGDNANSGQSWGEAKKDIQDAINDLVNNNLKGEVWVAAGTYYPTETTESSGSQYYKAFKIPAGITVRGGFAGTEEKTSDRHKTNNNLFGKGSDAGELDGESTKGGVYTNKTILSGSVTKKAVGKTWNSKKEQFDFTFYGNSYHVVFFAMNGFDANGRANALASPAKLEGCIIEGGHAYSNDASTAHPHIAYGGGIYMVANSFVYNCEVRNCDASRNGGGIYMDGGGIVRRTLVHDCQALGLGTEYGLGGGICEDGKDNSKSNPIVVAQSAVTNCVGRIGGGMALISNQTDKGKYAIVANSTLVNNNTATTEAGGVYTYHGCGLASMTIARNKCNGSGIVQNGVATGRAGGVYSRDEAYIGNCVIWGNACNTSSDVQYASSRTSISSSEKTHFYYNAVSKADNTDWSGATKMGILPLDDKNSEENVDDKGKNGYPLFENPTQFAGYLANVDYTYKLDADGKIIKDAEGNPIMETNEINWKVFSESALHHAGINTADLDYEGLTPAPQGKSYDMQFGVFNPRCTMGAFISEMPSLAPEIKGDEAHFYVDPNYNFAQHHEGDTGAKGMSWDRPTRFLGNVLEYIKANATTTLSGKTVFVHVKEGVVDNTDSYKFGRVRTSTLDVPSNVTLLGSYAKSLTGTNLNKRNPVTTPTIISGELLDAYKYNVAHLINIENASNVTIDGFKISYANAASTELANDNTNGAAITIKSSTTNIKLKNIIVSNSQAECGAAVYADASTASFENCIFHNNTTTQHNNSGIVYATNNSHLNFDHCDVLRNVGHASYLGSNGTTNVWTNSIFYGNLDRAKPDTNTDTDSQVAGYPGRNKYALAAFSGNTANATGNHCMFDFSSSQFASKFNNNDTGNKWQYDLQYKFADGAGEGYPRFINPTKNSGYSEHGDETYYGRATSFEPHNNNPIVNMASIVGGTINTEWGKDIVDVTRDFGGRPDIGAVENHEAQPYDNEGNPVENAYRAGQPAYGAIMYVRDYETEASKPGTHVKTYDKGADGTLTENTQNKGLYNAQGQFLDGYSWATAINGNAMYAYEPGTISTTVSANTYFTTSLDGGSQSGYKLKIGNYYLTTTGSQLFATTNVNDAAVWNFSTTYGGTAQTTPNTQSKYIWTEINGTRYYMTMQVWNNGGYPGITTSNSADASFNVNYSANNNRLRFSRVYNNTNIYLSCTGDYSFAGTGTRQDYYISGSTGGGSGEKTLKETATDGASLGNLAANTTIGKFTNLHVYNTLADAQRNSANQNKGIVTYNIALYTYKTVKEDELNNDGITISEKDVTVPDAPYYIAGTTSLSAQEERASSGKYVLINAGTATLRDKVYIYDLANSKYVVKSESTITLGDSPYAWWIKDSSRSGYLNIIDGTIEENSVAANSDAWSMATAGELSFGSRTANAAQLVMVNNEAYAIWNTTTTTTGGHVVINGLQYAVNTANKNLHLKDRIVSVTEKYGANQKTVTHTYQDLPVGTQDGQVWVGAGLYQNFTQYSNFYDNASKSNPTDYTAEGDNTGYGYLVRNHVKVYGGFPAVGNPGMDERHPQLSRGIAMSKANTAARLNVTTYETILQTNIAKNNETYKGSVLATPYECAVTMAYDSNTPRNRTVYEGAEWDGFTLQYGYRNGFNIRSKDSSNPSGPGTGRRVGGGGACLYENIVLRNCVVRDNSMKEKQQCRGGGVYCDGGILENCYLLMNETNCSTSNFGGGMYMIQGTMFNSVVAGNTLVGQTKAQGAGIFIESAKFYNNTIVNNIGGTAIACYTASKADASLTIYNSIVIAQAGKYAIERTSTATPLELVHCYVKSDQAAPTSGLTSLVDDGSATINGTVTVRDNTKSAWGIARERANKIFFGSNKITDVTDVIGTDLNKYNPFVLAYDNTNSDGHGANYKYDYRINQKALESGIDFNCVNAATEDIGKAELPDFDMDFTDRIQDCALDIGAYEFNGAYTISPDIATVSGQAIFYVTPNGSGTSAGNDPANAACAQKLQKILDAAGRYKYVNPDKQVIVKVTNSKALQEEKSDFKYYATRTTDYTDQDVRVWAIEVPRGVELWGGYTDVPTKMDNGKVVKDTDNASNWGNTYNGFYSGSTDLRDITGNPTYFDSYYYNKGEKSEANTYHVIKFTDRIYDPEGYAYLLGEEEKIKEKNADASTYRDLATNDESQFVHMSVAKDGKGGVTGNVIMDGETPKLINGSYASNRAVIDGIFVTGGAADGSLSSNNSTLNINAFGGAAVVTDYAYVRNCVLEGNKATNGGALALTDRALVSGTIIVNNTATEQGGGIYVFEDGAKLSNGYVIDSQAPENKSMDYRMAHVFTSTIAGNNAQQGGGVWYTEEVNTNARFNSVAIWDNNAADQANVFGMVNPEQPTDDETNSDEFYPFSYSYIQNIRASGTNNMSVQAANKAGVRFVDPAKDVNTASPNANAVATGTDYGYYGLTNYSVLNSAGMPVSYYNILKSAIAIADADIMGKQYTADIQGSRKYVEAGARVLGRTFPTKQLMLRLFVAQPEDVDDDLATKFMELTGTAGSAAEYYSQQGSSFAYPFNSLQAALDYIKLMRSTTQTGATVNGEAETYISKYHANNLPFEILVGRGTYYPKESLTGSSNNVWASTYAIPEGVTIMGGFNPQGGGAGSYYGRYYEPAIISGGSNNGKSKAEVMTDGDDDNNHFITANITPIPTGTANDRGFTYGTETVNQDGVNVTFQLWHIMDIGDRRAMDDNNHNGIIEPWEFKNQTIISGNAVNGETDGVYHILSACPDEDAVGILPNASIYRGAHADANCSGYSDHEEGQQIRLNGLIVTGGNALTYLNTALDEYGSYNYYLGAGLNVDGNRYKDSYHNKSASLNFDNTHRAAYGVGYRDIPVSITNCQFRNNIAGYGGAITSNGSLTLFASSFEQNLAIGATEEGPFLDHNGNTIDGLSKIMYPGQGGAIHATHQLSAFNCLFANNEARLDEGETMNLGPVLHSSIRVPNPTIGTVRAAGGAIMMGTAGQHHIVNCDFVKNKANMYPAVFTMNPTFDQNATTVNTHFYSQIINTVAWQNEVNPEALKAAVGTDYAAFPFASKLMVNVGRKDRKNHSTGVVTPYVPAFTSADAPVSQTALDGVAGDGNTAYQNSVWQEAAWFCAYEDGVGFTPDNTNDLRALHYDPTLYSIEMIKSVNNNVYQNCNIQIVSDNANLAGPNFGKPSVMAGYDGYMESADWSPARVNRLTDNGNGFLKQNWANDGTLSFKKWGTAPGREYTTESETDYANDGAYPVTHYIKSFPEYKYYMSLGDEKYMETTSENQTETVTINGVSVTRQKNLPRISYDPTPGAELAYIDIGVYEYIKRPLKPAGNEVDILWVSTIEKPENGDADGSSWKQPTSDLQRAIETLLASRNGHKKEVRVMEGEYSPVQTYTKNINGVDKKIQAFVIDTKALNGAVITPTGGTNADHYAQSITIKGGYSADRQYEYDPAEYETIIRQQDAGGSANTDYLIYIGDPTQRYAFSTYTPESNGDGSKLNLSSPVQTMPIQIDGVTLINDKATAGTKGSAIYYPNYTSDVVQPKAVNVGGSVVYYKNKTEFDKMDGANHIGQTSETETDYQLIVGGEPKENPAKLIITKTKIVGSGDPNATTDNGSAVYIGQYGGFALIYNTVFGDNFGKPLEAYNTINVNNTFGQNGGQIVLKNLSYNATVNSAAVAMTPSMLHNTAMWQNNKGNTQFAMSDAAISAGVETLKNLVKVADNGDVSAENDADLEKIFTYNSFTGGNIQKTSDADLSGNKYNTGLVAENSNIINGPNFVDPLNADIYARNYDIKPSLRLLNKGNGYKTVSGEPAVENYDVEGTYNDLVVKNKYDFSLEANTKVDVLTRTRIVSQDVAQRIDIGAYEYQSTLKDILYVDPNKSHSDTATGDNWNEALGYGDLQNAIDLVGLAYATKASDAKTPSYVFVKGNSSTSKDKNMNETVTLRDGVQVYGSILSSNTNWHEIKDENDVQKYSSVEDYIRDIRLNREGVASTHANKTIVTGIKTSEFTSFDGNDDKSTNTPAIIDGFVVTDPNDPTAPVLDITNDSKDATIVVRNVIVADNDMSKADGNVNVAQISNGLIYEALFRDNKPKGNGAVLKVGNYTNTEADPNYTTKGYAVNVTVEGKTIGADGSTPVDGENESGTQIYKSITNSIDGSQDGAYGKIVNKGIFGYYYNIGRIGNTNKSTNADLNYQLSETSKYIDACEAVNPLTGVADNLAKFINYKTDRDILGNPRLLAGVTTLGKIDRGAFETWKVENNWNTGHDNSIAQQSGYTGTTANTYEDDIKYTFYPHAGSAVYLMKNKHIVLDAPGAGYDETTSNPGFLLVKEGASLYTNGRHTTVAYVAVERTIPTAGAVVSVPYAMNYNNDVVLNKTTDGDLDIVKVQQYEARYYNGGKRSDWQHVFQKDFAENNADNCWVLANDVVPANSGVYYKPADSNGQTYRFTAQGTVINDYIYEEYGPTKTVTLTKYDDAESTNNGADYTDELDMGWNCIGLPYLVSEYKTYNTVSADMADDYGYKLINTAGLAGDELAAANAKNEELTAIRTALVGQYMMHTPKEMWLYYNGTKSPDNTDVNGDGGYYSVKSWDTTDHWNLAQNADESYPTPAIWVGEGIFMQTATVSDKETLTFYRPIAPTVITNTAKRGNVRYYSDVTGIQEIEDNEAVTLIGTEYYTTDGIRINKPQRGIVIVRELYSNGKTRTVKRQVK